MKFVDERTLSIFAPSRESMDETLAKVDEAMNAPDPEVRVTGSQSYGITSHRNGTISK